MPVPNKTDVGIDIIPVTPNDSVDLEVLTRGDEKYAPRALLLGGAGDLKINTINGQTRIIPDVPVGIFPVQVTRVFLTDTTATSIAAIY